MDRRRKVKKRKNLACLDVVADDGETLSDSTDIPTPQLSQESVHNK